MSLPCIPHGPITPLHNLKHAGHLDAIKAAPEKGVPHLSSFQKLSTVHTAAKTKVGEAVFNKEYRNL